jgi:hypothetical protein
MFTSGSRLLAASKVAGPPASDPFIANVGLLMHGEGVNNGTVFTDFRGHVPTRVGNTVTSTSQFKYGSSSISFDGASALSFGASANLAMGAGDFTMECWIFQTARPAICSVLCASAGGGSTGITIQVDTTGAMRTSTASAGIVASSAGVISLNTWTHMAASRTSGSLTMWVAGALVATVANATNFTDNVFFLGEFGSGSQKFTGFLDEIRLTPGTGRYTAPFTPIGPFPEQ